MVCKVLAITPDVLEISEAVEKLRKSFAEKCL